MKYTILFILLLAGCQVQAQDKPISGEVGTIPLVRFRLERKPHIDTLRNVYRTPEGGLWHNGKNVFWVPAADTIPALITAHHKIRPKSVTFYGYVVRNGKRSEYYDECWQKMPDRWVMVKYEKR